ncbi:MAG: AAA family ATPase [Piscinibacter sp.]|nr:AAA family ATPase [Piscinibacter sp.]
MQLRLAAAPCAALADGSVRELAPIDAALLAWLALEGPTPRARLAALLWPASDGVAARNALRQRLFQLRRLLGADTVTGGTTIALAGGVVHDLDDADNVLGAVGDAFGPELAAWLGLQRERRRERMHRSLAELADLAERAQQWGDALLHAQELLALDPLNEATHRRVIRLHDLRGDRAAALLAFDACERLLKDEVGTGPSAETLALLETLERTPAVQPVDGTRLAPAALLRPPRLVGRDRAWAALLDAAAAGRVALLEGEAGMGKTRLAGDFAQRDPDGTIVVSARPGDAPHASLLRLARAALRCAGDLPPAVRRPLARLLPEFGDPPPGGDEAQAARLLAALEALLAAAVRGGLRQAIVDDLHFADTASAETLLHLAGGDAALAWVFAARPAEWPAGARAAADELLQAGRAVSIPLSPLTTAQIAELVDSLGLPGFDGTALAPRLAQHSGGNPLFLLETLKAMRTTPSPATTLPAAASVAQLVGRRIGQLSPDAVRLARCAAVAGQDFSSELATELLGARPLDLADAWAELEAAQVLREQAFAHDLIHEAALASVPPALARQLHGRIASYLAARAGAPERIAAHWLASAQPDAAAPHLVEAGRRALRALRKSEAAQALARAAELLEHAGDRRGAFDALDTYFAGMPVWDETSRALVERMRALAQTPVEHALAAQHHADLLNRTGDFAGCSAIAEEALQLVEPADAPVLVATLMTYQSGAKLYAGDAAGAAQAMYRAVAVAETGDDEDRLASIVAALGSTLDWAGRAAEALPHHARAMEIRRRGIGPPEVQIATALNCAANRMELGWLEEARPLFEFAERAAASHDLDLGREVPALLVHRARLLLDLGEYTQAVRQLEDALPVIAERMQPWLIGLETIVATLWMRLGQWARARRMAQQALARSDGAIAIYAARARLVAAEVEAALGRPADMQGALDEAERRLRGGGPRVAHQISLARCRWLEPADALALAGRVRDAADATGVPGLVLSADLRASAAARRLGDDAAAHRHAQAAIELFDTGVEPLGLYRAEVWLTAVPALRAAAPARADSLQATALRWLNETAGQRVPAEFRDSFLHRNEVNRELLALAARGA